jgi:hypothetical protein
LGSELCQPRVPWWPTGPQREWLMSVQLWGIFVCVKCLASHLGNWGIRGSSTGWNWASRLWARAFPFL